MRANMILSCENGGVYRYSSKEVESMKARILAHTEADGSAWRLRNVLEGLAYCTACGKKEFAKRVRELALFESLVNRNDFPSWNAEA